MFASPIAYPSSLVHERWRVIYELSSMAGIIVGFRWALLGRVQPSLGLYFVSVAIVSFLLFSGVVYFRRMERTFADVI